VARQRERVVRRVGEVLRRVGARVVAEGGEGLGVVALEDFVRARGKGGQRGASGRAGVGDAGKEVAQHENEV